MRFNDYKTMRPAYFSGTTEDYIQTVLSSPRGEPPSQQSFATAVRSRFESSWLRHERPFYNVFPIAIELCQKTQLTMTWGDVLFPTKNLLLRFSEGHEPLGITSALIRAPSSQKISTPHFLHSDWAKELSYASSIVLGGVIQVRGSVSRIWAYESKGGESPSLKSEPIKETCVFAKDPRGKYGDEADEFAARCDFLIRLLAFIGLLARGNDLITPAVLGKDRSEYDVSSDNARKRWLEERAARRQGRGFDVGRSLEIERASSPHWRCPHLALFHTGPGRTTPVLKVRSGCVVIPKDMSSVPTGYLGQERPDEQPQERSIKYRTPIPKKVRFRVLRRDRYRCRLCGLTAEDGVQLEVDHKVPVAKGGCNAESNLWTLCQPCNSGKSDSDLNLTTTTAE